MVAAISLTKSTEASGRSADAPEVLAVVADTESAATLQDLADLDKSVAMQVVRGTVRDAKKVLAKLPRSPRLLIIDISGVDLPLSEIDDLAEVCEPSVRVIVIGENADIGLFRELMRIGVTDYLVKPVLPDLISPYLAVGSKPDRAHHGRTGKVIAVAGSRGGAGVTTLATSVGIILANVHHRRVLLIDLHPIGGAMSVQLNASTGGLMEALDNVKGLDALFLERALVAHGPRLFVLGDQLDYGADQTVDPAALESLLQILEQQFHYVIVDLPRHGSAAHAAILRRAGLRLFVSDRTVPAVRDLSRMLGAIDGTGGRTVLVLNDARPGAEAIASRKLMEESLGRTFDMVIPFDKNLPRLVDNLGQAITETRGPFPEAMRELAGIVIGQRRRQKRKRLLGLIKAG
jgi:pilus assembly protein CpaE